MMHQMSLSSLLKQRPMCFLRISFCSSISCLRTLTHSSLTLCIFCLIISRLVKCRHLKASKFCFICAPVGNKVIQEHSPCHLANLGNIFDIGRHVVVKIAANVDNQQIFCHFQTVGVELVFLAGRLCKNENIGEITGKPQVLHHCIARRVEKIGARLTDRAAAEDRNSQNQANLRAALAVAGRRQYLYILPG